MLSISIKMGHVKRFKKKAVGRAAVSA